MVRKAVKKAVKKEEVKTAPSAPRERYIEAVGRRKTAVARVRIMQGGSEFLVNQKDVKEYFTIERWLKMALAPLTELKLQGEWQVSARVMGGGSSSQAEAVRHGLARALSTLNEEFKRRLRGLGFLTRDPRMVERKKYGLKKARRAPQWQKR